MSPTVDLAALADRLPRSPLTRFAPSPSGYLHLGHIVNAVYVWGTSGAIGGRVLVRIEDHDRERAVGPSGELRYPGTCRERGLPLDEGLGLRVRISPGVDRFVDVRLGPQAQEPAAQCGDLLVRDRVGQWTYQFAVTVDDIDQQVDLVIRGEDLLASTGRQIQLARRLGRDRPTVFLHHPLLYGTPGVKLSKSNRDSGVRELRAAGATPADVLGLAAARCGLLTAPRPIDRASLADLVTGRLR